MAVAVSTKSVEAIRSFLANSDQSYNERLPELAQAYGEACEQANARLVRCAELLRQGLRSEALQAADAEPRLLDALAELDFAGRDVWIETCQLYNLPTPPELMLSAAEYLNASYAEEDPLRDLLRRHRRLALARAPLSDRIAVLGALAERDPDNPVWEEDRGRFEHERLKQIKAEASDAARAADLATLARLRTELALPSWKLPVPQSLVQGLVKAQDTLGEQAARRELPKLADALNESFAAFDVAEGRMLRDRWQTVLSKARLPHDHPVHEKVEPALHWLEERDRSDQRDREFAVAVADLESAIEEQAPKPDVERLLHAARRFDRELPPTLQQRSASYLAGLDLAAGRRNRLILAATVAGLVGASGLGFVVLRQRAQDRAVREAAAAIAQAVSDGRLADAAKFRDRLATESPALRQAPLFAQAEADLAAAEAREAERRSALTRALAAAESAPIAAAEPADLVAAAGLASTDSERRSIEDLRARRSEDLRREIARNDTEATPRLEQVGPEIVGVENDLRKANSPPDLMARIDACSTQLDAIEQGFPMISEAVQSVVRVERKRLDEARQVLLRREARAGLELAITQALGRPAVDPDEVEKSLRAVVAADPGTKRTRDFDQVIRDRSAWGAYLEWRQLSADWRGDQTPAPATARTRVAQIRAFLKQYPGAPSTPQLEELARHYEAIGKLGDEDEGPRAQLIALFSDPLVSPVYLIQINQRSTLKKLYVNRRPQPVPLGRQSYLTGQGDKQKALTIGPNEVQGTGESPQMRLAGEFKRELNRDGILLSWIPQILKQAERIHSDADLDPILKIKLLRGLLRIAGQGNLPLARASAEALRQLEESPVDEKVAWMDPDDALSEVERTQARAVLDELPSWGSIETKARELEEQIQRGLMVQYAPVGWLAQDDGWNVRLAASAASQGELYVLMNQTGKPVWKSIGRIESGQARIDPTVQTLLTEGQPVFCRAGGTAAP